MILDLARELGLDPKKTSSHGGGEFHSACPICGGRDRFMLWPEQGRYWCRQCGRKGDTIQFCRDFFQMSYPQACEKAGKQPKEMIHDRYAPKPYFEPKPSAIPSKEWQQRAKEFVVESHEVALGQTEALRAFQERGIALETVKAYGLGWNVCNRFDARNLWGLAVTEEKKDVRLPPGIVIPTFFDGMPMKLKIRRSNWQPEDRRPKYIEISGSRQTASFYGKISGLPVLILEAELDAILVQQIASDLCCCMAIGGVGKKPDLYVDQILRQAPKILFALDFDEAGRKAYLFWRCTYENIQPWPVPSEKSPGDAYKRGVNIREWIVSGLNYTK